MTTITTTKINCDVCEISLDDQFLELINRHLKPIATWEGAIHNFHLCSYECLQVYIEHNINEHPNNGLNKKR